jgi:hypothetical protein
MANAAGLALPVADPAGSQDRPGPMLTVLSLLAVVLPFLAAGVHLNLTGTLMPGGEQALLALDVRDAAGVDQLVGTWTGMGWAQPGPVWLYVLAGLEGLFGATATGLVAASLTVHATFAALLVLAVGRSRPWYRPLMALVVLGFVLRMPAEVFVQPFDSYAVLLPTSLALVLGARAATGSVPALGGLVAVGSFLVQTHIRTAPLVAFVGVVAVVGLARQLAGRRSPRPGRRDLALALGGVVVAAAMWVPPLRQQLNPGGGRGNLSWAVRELLGGEGMLPTQTWRQAFSAVGQLLGAPVYGWPATAGVVDTSSRSVTVVLALVGQAAGAMLLIVLARRMREPFVAALGAVVLAGSAAAPVAAKTVEGQLDSSSIFWVTVLPAVLLFGWASLAASLVHRARPVPARWARPAVAVALVVSAVLAGVVLLRTAAALPDEPGVGEALDVVRGGLPAAGTNDPVLLDIGATDLWPTAAGLVALMEQAGEPVRVGDTWVELVGSDRGAAGDENWRVTLVAEAGVAQVPFGAVIGAATTRAGDAALILSRAGN